MTGVLACRTCTVETQWSCETPNGEYVSGHLPGSKRTDFDSWSHLEAEGTHVAMVRTYPWSALQQGAGDYLRWLAARPTTSRIFAPNLAELQGTIDRWDRENRQSRRR